MRLGLPVVDVLAAFFIIVLIGRAAFQIVRASFGVLSDASSGRSDEIARAANAVEGVLGCHRVRARGLADDLHVDLHVLVDRCATREDLDRGVTIDRERVRDVALVARGIEVAVLPGALEQRAHLGRIAEAVGRPIDQLLGQLVLLRALGAAGKQGQRGEGQRSDRANHAGRSSKRYTVMAL